MLKQPAYVISAPSGAGKGSIVSMLLASEPGMRLARSWTTRSPRKGDCHKYKYVTHDEFMKAVAEGKFLEWQPVYDHFYGTCLEGIPSDAQLIVEIDYKGALVLKERFPKLIYTIFILPPSLEELEKRLRQRGADSEEQIKRRLEAAPLEISHATKFDSWIENDTLESATRKLRFLIMARRNGMLQSPAYTNPFILHRVQAAFTVSASV